MSHYRTLTRRLLVTLCFGFLAAVFAQELPETVDNVEEIGRSVEGRAIVVRRLGAGSKHVIIVGGIHGGYEANSILLTRELFEYYAANPEEIPVDLTLHFIENMNPDGLYRVTGGVPVEQFDFRSADIVPGRFNANGVDLNRNWDGDWQPTSFWGTRVVSAGSAPFSEPETQAVRGYFERVAPVVSVFYQSAADGLWYSGADEAWAPSRTLAEIYSAASGYRLPEPDAGPVAYEITGSADDYFVEIRHRNLTVELRTRFSTEFERNLRGLRAILAAL
ncbi:MAG: M14 family metallopeptidase [Spirochaetales bacterium]